MSTQLNPTSTKVASPEDPAPKPQRSSTITLTGADGAIFRVVGIFRKDGTGTCFGVHTVKGADGKRINQRGATTKHPNTAATHAAMEKLVAAATKAGWARKERRVGFTAKPDAFGVGELPPPPKVSKRR